MGLHFMDSIFDAYFQNRQVQYFNIVYQPMLLSIRTIT